MKLSRNYSEPFKRAKPFTDLCKNETRYPYYSNNSLFLQYLIYQNIIHYGFGFYDMKMRKIFFAADAGYRSFSLLRFRPPSYPQTSA